MRSLLILFIFLALGCAESEKFSSPDAESFANTPAIIFVPGYYGSNLREVGTGQRVFVTAREILFGDRALSLGAKELGAPPAPELEPDGILEAVSVVPGLYSVDVYGGILHRLARMNHVQVIPFAYDWRRDLVETAAKLQDVIARLRKSGVSDIRIVAHSMGGLVTLYSLAYGKQELEAGAKPDWRGAEGVNAIVFLGVPFRGVLSPFRNMYRGIALSYNHSFFPPAAVASFPASYALTSYDGVVERSGADKPTPLNLADPKVWRAKNAGLYQDFAAQTPEVRAARVAFTEKQVTRGAAFRHALELTSAPAPKFKVMNVIGKGARVMSSFFTRAGDPQNPFIFDVDDPKKDGLNDELIYSDGDGTVSVESAHLSGVLGTPPAKELTTTFGHAVLFNDPNVRSAMDQFIKE